MSIWFQPFLVDAEEEMAPLGLPGDIGVRAYLMARQDLLAASIDVFDVKDAARRYDLVLSGDADPAESDSAAPPTTRRR
ncbi:hypothetical protein KF840_02610 [bacterium]|nr:hypothetical protein [bacterium]